MDSERWLAGSGQAGGAAKWIDGPSDTRIGLLMAELGKWIKWVE